MVSRAGSLDAICQRCDSIRALEQLGMTRKMVSVRCHISTPEHGNPRKSDLKDLLIMNMIRMIRAFLGGSKVVYTWPAASPEEAVLEISDVFQETPPEAPLCGRGKPWVLRCNRCNPMWTAHLSFYRFCMFVHVFFSLDSFVKITLLFFTPPSNIFGSYQRDNHSSSRTSRSLSMLCQFLSLLAIFFQHFNIF
jgi:hypothetical protein